MVEVFLKRNGHHNVTQHREKFTVDRLDWMTLDNISQMFDILYDEMIDAEIVKKIEDPIFMDCDGDVVDKLNCFGKRLMLK